MLVGLEEVAADVVVGLLLDRVVQRADELVLLQLAVRALPDGLGPLLDPARRHADLVLDRRLDRRVDREVVVIDLLGVGLAGALLVGHAGRAHDQGGHGVAVLRGEEVVLAVVAERDRLRVELALQRRADPVLDEVEREVRDLVVDRVLVGREEVPARGLVGVDEEDARVVVHLRDEDRVLLLVLRPEVTVRVKAPGRGAGDAVAAVRVADGLQEVVHELQTALVLAVRARHQLVDLARDRLRRGGLAAVRCGRDPGEGRPRGGGLEPDLLGDLARAHAAPEGGVAVRRVEVGDVLRRAQHVELDVTQVGRGAAHVLLDQPHARVGLGLLRRGGPSTCRGPR